LKGDIKMIDKFQKIFDEMGTNEKVIVELDFYEVSRILALLKSNNAYEQALEECLNQGFKKAEQEFK
jgi:hypothetical protein